MLTGGTLSKSSLTLLSLWASMAGHQAGYLLCNDKINHTFLPWFDIFFNTQLMSEIKKCLNPENDFLLYIQIVILIYWYAYLHSGKKNQIVALGFG